MTTGQNTPMPMFLWPECLRLSAAMSDLGGAIASDKVKDILLASATVNRAMSALNAAVLREAKERAEDSDLSAIRQELGGDIARHPGADKHPCPRCGAELQRTRGYWWCGCGVVLLAQPHRGILPPHDNGQAWLTNEQPRRTVTFIGNEMHTEEVPNG